MGLKGDKVDQFEALGDGKLWVHGAYLLPRPIDARNEACVECVGDVQHADADDDGNRDRTITQIGVPFVEHSWCISVCCAEVRSCKRNNDKNNPVSIVTIKAVGKVAYM